MMVWLSVLILAAQSAAPMEHQYAETIFATDFERGADLNYDAWPDDWTRLRGQGFPPYIRIGITDDTTDDTTDDPSHASPSTRCLRIDLDGSGGTAFSPPIEISPLFSYLLCGRLKTEGLQHDVAYFSVTFFDLERNQQETITSDKVTDATTWKEFRIGPLTPSHPETRLAVIGLHLVPTARSDLTGAAMFDDLRFARMPHLTIESSQPFNLFAAPSDPVFLCTVSGTRQPNSIMLLELLDVTGRVLAAEHRALTSLDSVMGEATEQGDPATAAVPAASADVPYVGSLTWRPPVSDYGYYHVRASLRSAAHVPLQQSASFAVVPDLGTNHKGEFGWSLPRSDKPLSEDQLLTLLRLANVTWIKYPIWYSPDEESAKGDRIAFFADQLKAQDIEMVGVFDRPPEQVRRQFSSTANLTVAEVFLEPKLWSPVIDPLMLRLALKIQWWQLGADDDESFIDYGGLDKRIRAIRAHVRQFGQRVRLGLAWNWLHETPVGPDPPWDFLALTESPPFTSQELARYSTQPRIANQHHWLTFWPLSRAEYDVQTRTRDLVLRMISARVHGHQAAFTGDPFDATRGLLHEDGTPQDLFLPWCITSRVVGGAEYLGSLQLPNGSHNHVFARDNEAIMVVWNDRPVIESLYLGDHVVQFDPWGRGINLSPSSPTPATPANPLPAGHPPDAEQTIHVGTMPIFVTGLDLAVTRWRLNFSFEPNELGNIFAQPQKGQLRFRNTCRQGVAGTMRLHVPDVWDISHPQLRFKLATDEELGQDFRVVLHANASSGHQRVRVDFDVRADREYHFSVYRQIQVGHGDVVVELSTWLDDEGNLIVEQHLINHTERTLNVKCSLFPPGRRRLRIQLSDVGPGRVTHTFKLPDGRELLGTILWLRVEELGSDRLMNYHVLAEP